MPENQPIEITTVQLEMSKQDYKTQTKLDAVKLEEEELKLKDHVKEAELKDDTIQRGSSPNEVKHERPTSIRSGVRKYSKKRKVKPWYLPSSIVDHLVHVNPFGKLILALLAFLTTVDYGKDLFVLAHLAYEREWLWFYLTLIIMVISLRLMMLAVSDQEIKPSHLLFYWIIGSVYFDSPRDTWFDVVICMMWELLLLLAVPFTPFYLLYISIRKSYSLFSGKAFRDDHALAFGVIEFFFETIPQIILQTVMYIYETHFYEVEDRLIHREVLKAALIIGGICALRLPVILWFNRRIIYRLNFKRHHGSTVSCVDFCGDCEDDIIATGSWDGTVIIHKIVERQFIKAKRCIPMGYTVNDIKFLRGTDLIGVAGYVIELFDWRTGKYKGQIPRMDSHIKQTRTGRLKMLRSWTVKAFTWCQENRFVAAAMGSNIAVYNVDEGQKTCEVQAQTSGPGEVCAVAFSPCGTILASGGFEKTIRLWRFNPTTGILDDKCFRKLEGHDGVVTSLSWCPQDNEDGNMMVSGSDDCTLVLWRPTARGDRKVCRFKGHEKEVTAVAFSHNGRYIASASRDRSVRLWNVETRTCEKKYDSEHSETISALAVGPFDDMIVSGSEDQTQKLYTFKNLSY